MLVSMVLACAPDVDPIDQDPVPPPGSTTSEVPFVQGALCVNELMPTNVSVLVDDSGFRSPWIELHAPGHDVVLDGWFLTDDVIDPNRYPLNPALVVPSGAFVVLFSGRDTDLPLHAEGGTVGLFGPDGSGGVLVHGPLGADTSVARVPDCCTGLACLQNVSLGSPGATNSALLIEETVVPAGSAWSWFSGPGAPPDGWQEPEFDDSAWPVGAAPLGYGGPLATTVDSSLSSLAVRRWVDIEGGEPFSVTVEFRRDDGIAVWVDGVEVARDNLSPGPVTADTTAAEAIVGADEEVWAASAVEATTLAVGPRLVAAVVVQATPADDDLLFDLVLKVQRW